MLLSPVPDQGIAPAMIDGVVTVQLNVTDANHGYAKAAAGDAAKLASDASGGAQVLWKEAGTGVKWAVVWLGTPAAAGDGLPVGSIIMWGDAGTIPSGWQLCDGTNGTPDLRAKFIVGYKSGDADFGAVGNTGGTRTHKHADHDFRRVAWHSDPNARLVVSQVVVGRLCSACLASL